MPMAKLRVGRGELELKVWVLGRYVFRPEQVISIERYRLVPVIASGVRIVHNISEYPARVIFWTLNPDKVLKGIEESGFKPRAEAGSVHRYLGMAVRWQVIVAAVLLWNVLFLADFGLGLATNKNPAPGPFALVALAMFFVGSVLLRSNQKFQGLVLKPGRTATEVRGVANLLMVLSGFMFLVFLVIRIGMIFVQ